MDYMAKTSFQGFEELYHKEDGSWDEEVQWGYSKRREMQEVVPGLYLGPYSVAASSCLQSLLDHGLTHIVCVRHPNEAAFIKTNFPHVFKYKVVELGDLTSGKVMRDLLEVMQFIDSGLESGGKVLIHGNTGLTRSPALLIGYIMYKFAPDLESAYELVQRKRRCVKVEEKLMRVLKEWEVMCKVRAGQGDASPPGQGQRGIKRSIDLS